MMQQDKADVPDADIGDPGWTRTSGPEIRTLVLYTTELRGHRSGSCKPHNYRIIFNNSKPEILGR